MLPAEYTKNCIFFICWLKIKITLSKTNAFQVAKSITSFTVTNFDQWAFALWVDWGDIVMKTDWDLSETNICYIYEEWI
jgi:hypothetical protein